MPDLLPFLGEVAMRSSLVLATVFTFLFVMKRASASERHFVLVLGLVVTALIPVGLALSPKITWTISVPHQEEGVVPTQKWTSFLPLSQSPLSPIFSPVVKGEPSLLDTLTVTNGVIAFLTAGMLVQCWMLGQAVRAWRRIGRRAVKALLPDEVLKKAQVFAGGRAIPPILVSDQITVPLLSGWLRPAIILPSEAARWPSERLLMAVCHELAHFRRGDFLLLPLICFLRVLYWWHPLVWLALARLRRERENACDDLVLNQNFRASDYAELIVDAARHAREFRWQNGALAMASTSNVGARIGAILNPRLNRRSASRRMILTGLLLAFGLGWLLVAAQVQAENIPPTSDSTATDASKPQIQLEFKLIEINETTYLSHQKEIDEKVANSDLGSLINTVNQWPGASLLSAPSVTTQEGLKAVVDIVREMPFATKFNKDKNGKVVPSDFKTRDIGLSIEAIPTLTADKNDVGLKFKCKLTSFEGWKEISTEGRLPMLDTVSIETERLIGKHGDAVWVGNGATKAYMEEREGNSGPPPAINIAPKRILLLVSARPEPAEVQALVIPSNAMVQVSLKYFQISEKTYGQQTATVANALAMTDALKRGDMFYFSRLPDFDLLAEPAVLMKVGEQGVLEAVKKMSYPVKFVPDNTGKFIPSGAVRDRLLGIRLVMCPELFADGAISVNCFDEITTYKGMIDYGYLASAGLNEKQPVFNTSRMNGKYALVTGKPFGTWMRTNFDDLSQLMDWKTGEPPSDSQDAPKVRIAMIISAKLYSADGLPIPPH